MIAAGKHDTTKSGADQAQQPPGPPTTVALSHPFFASFEDVTFRMSEANEPVAVMKLGNQDAVLSLEAIAKQYQIGANSPDGAVLRQIAAGLKFVRGMRMGDDLPKEVTCRQPSWSPKERHIMIARQRLTLQMVTWVTGDEHIFTSIEELLQAAEAPQIKQNVNRAFAEAARELGVEKREDVTRYIEQAARELACIEALRDTFGDIKELEAKIAALRRIYSSDRSMLFNVDQVAKLMLRAVRLFQEIFDQVDAQTGEVMSMLKNITNQINYIREIRDHLYSRLMAWDDILKIWRSVYIAKSDENTNRIRDLYQFLAPRYMQTHEWVLIGKIGTNSAKPMGGQMRW